MRLLIINFSINLHGVIYEFSLFLSITVMLTSFIIKSLVVLVKFKLLRDERLEYTSNKNIDEMYDLMNAKEETLIRHHKQMLALHLSLLIFVLFIAYIY
ncbi:hypothetical protein DK925_13815 [Enterobacter cloacae]|nr:hypothetical protein DK925_13815 [Enterobacter cloacae]